MEFEMFGNAVLTLVILLMLLALLAAFNRGTTLLLIPEARLGSAHMTFDDRVDFSIRESNIRVMFGNACVLTIAFVVVAASGNINYSLLPLGLAIVAGYCTVTELQKFRKLLQKY